MLRVSATTAPFVELYAARFRTPTIPVTDAALTMLLPDAICGTTYLLHRYMLRTFTAKQRSHASGVSSVTACRTAIPALLNSTSTESIWRRHSVTASFTLDSSETSQST